ncbi:MAG TPA: acyl-CoA dehydrogenase family protein [Acidimicrobiales bacterium]|nr:acyl-CoA dehydrogenase family protein [Acidimicrobiales bacterium]
MGTLESGLFLDLAGLGEDELLIREQAHRIAVEVLRPAAWELDRMTPQDRIAPGSPFFTTMSKLKSLGYHRMFLPPEAGGPQVPISPLAQSIVLEEFGWGSLGLATAFLVDMLPVLSMSLFGSEQLKNELMVPWVNDEDGNFHGCWAITEPDHGSDFLGLRDGDASGYGRAQLVAEAVEGGWILRGQKSAWVSSGPIATHAAVHAQAGRQGDLFHSLFAVVPLDDPGVRRGLPADMLGVRDDPQGELFFDDVFVQDRYVLVPPGPFYPVFGDQLLCLTSSVISNVAVGVARAAFEEALNHARKRVQGGVPISNHKNIQLTLYSMFEKVETARTYCRAALAHTKGGTPGESPVAFGASPRHSRAAQIYAKRIAYEVAHDALQVFGAQGLRRDSLMEKLFRDARCLLIEDGTLEVLALDASRDLIQNYEHSDYDMEEMMAIW